MDDLEDLLKTFTLNGLKISARKCQLLNELQYMGNTLSIKDRRVCINPLESRLEVPKLKPTMTVIGCRNFVGMVNILSLFCAELQKLLKPIYDLTRKVDNLFGEKNYS